MFQRSTELKKRKERTPEPARSETISPKGSKPFRMDARIPAQARSSPHRAPFTI